MARVGIGGFSSEGEPGSSSAESGSYNRGGQSHHVWGLKGEDANPTQGGKQDDPSDISCGLQHRDTSGSAFLAAQSYLVFGRDIRGTSRLIGAGPRQTCF